MTSATQIPFDALVAYFADAGAAGAIVMRNPDFLDNLRRGGDCDLLTPNPAAHEKLLIQRLGQPERIQRRADVTSYFYRWGYIDHFPTCAWRGMELVDPEFLSVLSENRERLLVPALPRHLEAALTWVVKLLHDRSVKQQYRDAILEALRDHRTETAYLIERILGAHWGTQLRTVSNEADLVSVERELTRKRAAMYWRVWHRRPLRNSLGMIQLIRYEIRLRLRPQVPMICAEDLPAVTETVATACRDAWSAVAGMQTFPGLSWHPRRRLSWAPIALYYWMRIARVRSRGIVVLLPSSYQRAREVSPIAKKVLPGPELSLPTGDIPGSAVLASSLLASIHGRTIVGPDDRYEVTR